MSSPRRALVALLSLSSVLVAACAQEPTTFEPTTTSAAAGTPSGSGVTAGAGGGAGEGGASTSSGSETSAGPSGTTTGQGAGASVSGSGGEGPQPATFELAFDEPSAEMELRSAVALTLNIAANGYVGPVDLSVEGAPEDVVVELDSASIELGGSGSESVGVSVTTASDTASGAFALTLIGTVPAGTKEAAAVVTVEPVLTITIPAGLNGMSDDPPNTTAFGDYPTRIRALDGMSGENPVTILFFNADSVSHEIHADRPDQGFGHGNQPIPAGSFDPVVRQVNSPGTYDYYPHDIGTSILGRIVIE